MTNLEKQIIENLKTDEEITKVKVFKNKVVFNIEKTIKELNERLTKENPSEDFIQILKSKEVK
jgi:hypothetical protein